MFNKTLGGNTGEFRRAKGTLIANDNMKLSLN